MIVNLAEAKSKWCPFSRAISELYDQGLATINRMDGKPDRECMCLADGCMCWQWTGGGEEEFSYAVTHHRDNEFLSELSRKIADLYVYPGGYVLPENQEYLEVLTNEHNSLLNRMEKKEKTWEPESPGEVWTLLRKDIIYDDDPYGGLSATWRRTKPPETRHGYCGLGGKLRKEI